MKISQQTYALNTGWKCVGATCSPSTSFNLVFAFGSSALMADPNLFTELQKKYPGAHILLSTTAGEIMDTCVEDETISLTAISFESTTMQTALISLHPEESSLDAGRRLASCIEKEGLNNLFIISDGHHVNGSDLVQGIKEMIPDNITITGGLAGDGVRFSKTLVGLNCVPKERSIAAIGFYGANLKVTSGTAGGWDPFGPERLITRSEGNVLYELDGKPALEIYKKYLGEYASQLPSTGLLFPLTIRNGKNNNLVRTILAVNETHNSLIFAGNMPEGYYARLMKASFDGLIEGAERAAQESMQDHHDSSPEFAILISCVGRKLVLNQRIEEEVDVIREIFGTSTALAGFYSYGEISPCYNSPGPELHNQTMTITTFKEFPL